jgi:hypothetical protein
MRIDRFLTPYGLACVLLWPALARADLTLRRVMLSTGGVAYVEYAADVDGAARLALDVPLSQVDDVLKSLVVFDSAGGTGGIELPGHDDSPAALGDVPFGPEVLASPLAYLNALRGVALEVRGPRPMTGRLLRAETVTEPAAADRQHGAERTRVSLMSDDGLRQFILEDAESVQVADPALRRRIAAALGALRTEASSSMRHVILHGTGTGTRTLRVGYVVGAPLWKTTYRLVMPPAGTATGKLRLQGWAVLENTTGADWDGVQLALQYGNPVTFRQALYRSYFVTRPEVPVEVLGRLLPNVDAGATPAMKLEPPAPGSAPAPMSVPMPAQVARAAPQYARPAMAAPAEETTITEGAAETVFVLPTPIVLAAGHTASVPILDSEVSGSRIGLVQSGRAHPLSAIRLTNDTKASLPAGVITVYDPTSPAAFAGDARLGGLPAGESRLLSFAEDLRTRISWHNDDAASIGAITAANGVLRIDERLRWTVRATITAPEGEARDLLVEIPRQSNAGLAADNAVRPAEETATAWRYAVTLAAGETRTLTVASERITRQQVSLLQDETVVARLLGRPGLSDAATAGLRRLVGLRERRAARMADLERLSTQVEAIEHDEERIRANLQAVPTNDAMHTRLVRQLDSAEQRMDGVRKSIDQANAAVAQTQSELAAAVAAFTL